jgi:hypothetical protein
MPSTPGLKTDLDKADDLVEGGLRQEALASSDDSVRVLNRTRDAGIDNKGAAIVDRELGGGP